MCFVEFGDLNDIVIYVLKFDIFWVICVEKYLFDVRIVFFWFMSFVKLLGGIGVVISLVGDFMLCIRVVWFLVFIYNVLV